MSDSKRGWHEIKISLKDGKTATVLAKTIWLEVPGTDIEVKLAIHDTYGVETEFGQLSHYGSGMRIACLSDEHYRTGITDDRELAKSAFERVVQQIGAAQVLDNMRRLANPLNEPHKERWKKIKGVDE